MDLATFRSVQALVALSNALYPDSAEADMTNVHFDTAPLRGLQS
jgi:hypothetical protein